MKNGPNILFQRFRDIIPVIVDLCPPTFDLRPPTRVRFIYRVTRIRVFVRALIFVSVGIFIWNAFKCVEISRIFNPPCFSISAYAMIWCPSHRAAVSFRLRLVTDVLVSVLCYGLQIHFLVVARSPQIIDNVRWILMDCWVIAVERSRYCRWWRSYLKTWQNNIRDGAQNDDEQRAKNWKCKIDGKMIRTWKI